MKNKWFALALLMSMLFYSGCLHYSFTGASTTAKSFSIDQFYNNSDLAPANLGVTFTNKWRDYLMQNSSLVAVAENGELHFEGVITDYRLNPVAPTATSNTDALNRVNSAALTRLTIVVKVTFTDNTEPKNSFKDKQFSFFQDFDNNLDFQSVSEDLEKKIFEQIMLDIFNATVANW